MAFLDCTATVGEDGSLRVSELDRHQLNLHPGDAVTLRIVTAEKTTREMRRPRQSSKSRQTNWEEARQQLTEELSKVWPKGVSVTDTISEMRR